MSKNTDIKEKIIIAALKIIRTQGMRFVRHRAVAEEAGVSLGSTTYHFKNIQDLVLSAFEYWHKREDVGHNPYFISIENDIQNIDIDNIEPQALVNKLLDASKLYLRNQVVDKRENREIELAFHNEALRNNNLSLLLIQSWKSEMHRIEKLYQILGSNEPEQDAEMTFSLILHIEKRLMLIEENADFEVEFSRLSNVLERHFQSVMYSIGIRTC